MCLMSVRPDSGKDLLGHPTILRGAGCECGFGGEDAINDAAMIRLSFFAAKFATRTRVRVVTRVYASIFMRAVRETQE